MKDYSIIKTIAFASLALASTLSTNSQDTPAPHPARELFPRSGPGALRPVIVEDVFAQAREPESDVRRQRVEVRSAYGNSKSVSGLAGAIQDGLGGDRIPRPLLIFTSTPEESDVAELREDLAVMSRILDKNVREVASSSSFTAMGINVLTFPGTRPSRNLFLEDYGVIFALRVNMPLLRAAPENPGGEQEKEPVDTAWEEAKKEIFGHPVSPGHGPEPTAYNAHSVDELKETLINSLRNAANIRNLEDSSFVTIVVSGQPSGAPIREFKRALRFEYQDLILFNEGEESGSTLVLRAKKADIDQFAQDKDLDAFKEKISLVIY